MQAVRCCGDNGDDQVDGSICHVGNDEDDCDILAPNDFITRLSILSVTHQMSRKIRNF